MLQLTDSALLFFRFFLLFLFFSFFLSLSFASWFRPFSASSSSSSSFFRFLLLLPLVFLLVLLLLLHHLLLLSFLPYFLLLFIHLLLLFLLLFLFFLFFCFFFFCLFFLSFLPSFLLFFLSFALVPRRLRSPVRLCRPSARAARFVATASFTGSSTRSRRGWRLSPPFAFQSFGPRVSPPQRIDSQSFRRKYDAATGRVVVYSLILRSDCRPL